jgi:cytochrome b561
MYSSRHGLDRPSRGAVPYDAMTRLLHWTTAGLVLVLFALPQLWQFLPAGYLRATLERAHISLGVVLAVTIVVRIIWRIGFGRRLPPVDRGFQGHIAKVVHLLLYGLIVLQVLAGLSKRWVRGRGVEFFGLFDIPSPVTFATNLRAAISWVHHWNAWLIIGLVAAHIAAALFHHFRRRDGVLGRMLPSVTP